MGRKATVTKAKIIKEIALDPTKSQRDIAKKANVGLATVNRHIKEVEQNGTESKIIDKIIANDLDIVTLGQSIIVQRMQETPEKLTTKDIISATDTGARRVTIFRGDITKDDGGLKDGVTVVRGQ